MGSHLEIECVFHSLFYYSRQLRVVSEFVLDIAGTIVEYPNWQEDVSIKVEDGKIMLTAPDELIERLAEEGLIDDGEDYINN